MSEKYTPTTETLWEAYEYWSAGNGGATRDELERFLYKIKAEAWMEGSQAAAEAIGKWLGGDNPKWVEPANPYLEDV